MTGSETYKPGGDGEIQDPREALLRKRVKMGLAICALVLLLVPLVLGGLAYAFWGDVDRAIQDGTRRPETIEQAELDSRELRKLELKLKAVGAALEPEPFVTFSVKELSSQITLLMSTGAMPPSLRSLQIAVEEPYLKATTAWEGQDLANLLASWGFDPASSIYGPVLQYMAGLEYFQFHTWINPRVEAGQLTWDIVSSRVNDYPLPADIARWMQSRMFGPRPLLKPEISGRPLQEARVKSKGLYLKWLPHE